MRIAYGSHVNQRVQRGRTVRPGTQGGLESRNEALGRSRPLSLAQPEVPAAPRRAAPEKRPPPAPAQRRHLSRAPRQPDAPTGRGGSAAATRGGETGGGPCTAAGPGDAARAPQEAAPSQRRIEPIAERAFMGIVRFCHRRAALRVVDGITAPSSHGPPPGRGAALRPASCVRSQRAALDGSAPRVHGQRFSSPASPELAPCCDGKDLDRGGVEDAGRPELSPVSVSLHRRLDDARRDDPIRPVSL